ncbi:MAG: hypothetical protein RLZZ117_1920 [Cyanobacteriota bacterium]
MESRDLSAFVGGVSALGEGARLLGSRWLRRECWHGGGATPEAPLSHVDVAGWRP